MQSALTKFLSVVIAVGLSFSHSGAYAADSTSVPGQISADQCPTGYQYSTGISINVSTGAYTTICNAPPNDADLLLRQQDEDFQSRVNQAQSAAESASLSWNQANPGLQKCVQWGPIIHANGVGSSSGGVCANPVPLGDGVNTPVLSAPQVNEEVPVIALNPNIAPTNLPFYKEVPGQVGVEGCPSGYQGANGISVNATTGVVTTQCWTTEAWTAYRLGSTVWDKYQSTGGAFDVKAEVDRRNKLAALIARAKSVADAAAQLTPGVKRCSTWTGYGETGQVCGYEFIDPGSSTKQPTSLGVSRDESMLEASAIVTASSLKLKAVAKTKTILKSLTPKTCKAAYLRITKLKSGLCNYSITLTAQTGKKSTIKKSVIFVK